MPEDLPDECPECGYGGGWFVPEKQRIYAYEDGSLDIGRGNNTRWGQKLVAICNHPDCDATVNLYVEGQVVRRGEIEPSGASDIIDAFDDEFPKMVEMNCKRCGDPFISEVRLRQSLNSPGVEVQYKPYCGCDTFDSFMMDTMAELEDPSELQEELEKLKEFDQNSGDRAD